MTALPALHGIRAGFFIKDSNCLLIRLIPFIMNYLFPLCSITVTLMGSAQLGFILIHTRGVKCLKIPDTSAPGQEVYLANI